MLFLSNGVIAIRTKPHVWVSLLFWLFLFTPNLIAANGTKYVSDADSQNNRQEIERYLILLSQINSNNQSDGAGCHGSYGLFMGVGLQRSSWLQPSSLLDENINNNRSVGQTSLSIPKIFITKGLAIPIDLSFIGGNIAGNINQLAGNIQVTVFQGKGLPALALRGGYAALEGIHDTNFSTSSLAIAASYSFLRYFTLFTEGKIDQHDAKITAQDETSQTYLAVTNVTNPNDPYTSSWKSTVLSYGLKVSLYTSPLSLTVLSEQDSATTTKTYLGKISIML